MPRETLIPDEIIDAPGAITAEAMGAPAQLQVRSILGRMVAVEQLRMVTAESIRQVTVGGVAKAASLHNAIQPHEIGLRAIDDNVVQAATIGVNNAAMLILRDAQGAAAEIAAIGQQGRERLATMPNAAFVRLTLKDRAGAVLRGTYADLELRPGTPQLRLWQDIKQLVVGGVVERICDEYDRQEIAERKAEFARAIAEQMAQLEAKAAAAEVEAAAEVSEDTVSELIEEVLTRTRNGAQDVEYTEVGR
ncbi:MAG: hypothetical protein ACRDJW_01260 [Thermomicrobiales bacterium]